MDKKQAMRGYKALGLGGEDDVSSWASWIDWLFNSANISQWAYEHWRNPFDKTKKGAAR